MAWGENCGAILVRVLFSLPPKDLKVDCTVPEFWIFSSFHYFFFFLRNFGKCFNYISY